MDDQRPLCTPEVHSQARSPLVAGNETILSPSYFYSAHESSGLDKSVTNASSNTRQFTGGTSRRNHSKTCTFYREETPQSPISATFVSPRAISPSWLGLVCTVTSGTPEIAATQSKGPVVQFASSCVSCTTNQSWLDILSLQASNGVAASSAHTPEEIKLDLRIWTAETRTLGIDQKHPFAIRSWQAQGELAWRRRYHVVCIPLLLFKLRNLKSLEIYTWGIGDSEDMCSPISNHFQALETLSWEEDLSGDFNALSLTLMAAPKLKNLTVDYYSFRRHPTRNPQLSSVISLCVTASGMEPSVSGSMSGLESDIKSKKLWQSIKVSAGNTRSARDRDPEMCSYNGLYRIACWFLSVGGFKDVVGYFVVWI
ncbi:hypothetical protein K440DRAFT_639016 [Wilcoxina mikolae CBS 423.85]|nr:hypothetical protein K440DRAFT_639016 [Wilcoxina mikolae CBS 423.85]